MFSKAWSYAIRALIYLTEHRYEGPILSSVIASRESIPAPFLVKILGTLAGANIVSSTRGRRGGFVLKVDPNDISLYEIASLFEHPATTKGCVLGYGDCNDQTECPIHEQWVKPKEQIINFLRETTLASLTKMVPDKARIQLGRAGIRSDARE